MTIIRIGGIALGVLLVIAQVFQIDMTNPPVVADVGASGQVKEAMKRSCYGCHSNETVWPWYSNVAPASWLVAYDVHQGRAAVNFSSWRRYTAAQRLKMLKEINEEIADGAMPPFYYVYPMHLDARLSVADQRAFKQWITSESANLTQ
jgi:hypothetical protein